MPLAAYFRNVGAALFALLLIADFYLPSPPVAQREAVLPPAIRIHSDRKWPERVVFDTNIVIASAKPDSGKADVKASPDAGNQPTRSADVRDAFAMLAPPDSPATSIDPNIQRAKQKHVRSVRRNTRPRIMLASPQRQFEWFNSRYW